MDGFCRYMIYAAALAVLPLSAANAAAAEWDHNDSLMRFEEDGKKRRFVYADPRQALLGAGVKSGTVLFDGEEKDDGRIAGYAKLFRKGCDPVDYFVEGAYDKDKGEILLQGQAPIYSGDGCKITGYTDSGSASALLFTRLGDRGGRIAAARQEERLSEPATSEPRARSSYLPPSSAPRFEEEEREPADEPDYDERADEEREFRDYNYRERRAQRDGRYAEEDAEFFARRYGRRYYEPYEDDEDESDYYEEYDEPAYYPPRRRWWRY